MIDRNGKAELERDADFVSELLNDIRAGQNGDPIRLQDAAEKLADWDQELRALIKKAN